MTSRATIAGAPWLSSKETLALLAALDRDGRSAPALRFVGGCVRNTLLGLPVEDIDAATIHPPERVIELASAAGLKPVPTGLAHGTITVVVQGKPFEVTSLRVDVATYGRRAEVAFTDDWAADASRRDFTMNAIYADASGALFDPVGGVADLAARRVRFIGDAHARIKEDYLRILRFFRFHAWYGQGPLDAVGLEACKSEREGLKRLSAERIQKELLRLLEAPDPIPALKAMADSGILGLVLPETGDFALLASVVAVETKLNAADAIRRLASLLGGDGKTAGEVARRLRFSNENQDRLIRLRTDVTTSPLSGAIDERGLRRLLYRRGAVSAVDYIVLSWARDGAERQAGWKSLLAFVDQYRRPKLPITGHDVVALGLSGERIGEVLEAVENWWIEHDFAPDRVAALAKAREIVESA